MHEIEEFYREIRDHKISLMRRILKGDHGAAEDVVHTAFERAWHFYPSYDSNRGTLHTWFNSILFSSLRDYQREMRGDCLRNSKELSPEDIIISPTISPALLRRGILRTENQKHRRILELFFMLGYNSSQIASIEEGVTRTNVTTVVNRFKKELEKGVG
jgi:RNA polymerase sigma factor (sigma-70 family)